MFVVSGIGYGGWPSYLPANLVMFGSQADNIQGGSLEIAVSMTKITLRVKSDHHPSFTIVWFPSFKSPSCNCYNFDTYLPTMFRSDLNLNWIARLKIQ